MTIYSAKYWQDGDGWWAEVRDQSTNAVVRMIWTPGNKLESKREVTSLLNRLTIQSPAPTGDE